MSAIDELSKLPPPAPPAMSRALEAELARLAPVATRRPLRQLALLIAVSLLYGAGLVWWFAMRPDLHQLPMGWLFGVGLCWLLGFLVPMTLATVPARGSMMPRWRLAGVASVVASVAMVGLGLVLHPGAFELPGWSGVVHGFGCLEAGLETAVVPIILGTLALRRALPVGSRWVAAGIGAAGGSLGGLVLHLHCPVDGGLHVGLVHGGVVVVAALVAAALAPRITEVR